MLMTEADAREKWCPFSRVGEQASGATENRPDGSYNCIASACSQWVEIHASVHDTLTGTEHSPAKGVMACNPVGAARAIQHFQLAPYPNPNGFPEVS